MDGLHIEDKKDLVQDHESDAEEWLVDIRLLRKHTGAIENMPGNEDWQQTGDEGKTDYKDGTEED